MIRLNFCKVLSDFITLKQKKQQQRKTKNKTKQKNSICLITSNVFIFH